MTQRRAFRMLGIRSFDPVLHHIAPLGLAAAAGTALVVDLDRDAAPLPGPTLAQLLEEGVRQMHLAPTGPGVAVFANGGVEPSEVEEFLGVLAQGWPAMVLRLGRDTGSHATAVPVIPLLPGLLAPRTATRPAVYQRIVPGGRLPGPGIGLPPLGRGAISSMLAGVVEPRWRWVRAWSKVWELPWQ